MQFADLNNFELFKSQNNWPHVYLKLTFLPFGTNCLYVCFNHAMELQRGLLCVGKGSLLTMDGTLTVISFGFPELKLLRKIERGLMQCLVGARVDAIWRSQWNVAWNTPTNVIQWIPRRNQNEFDR